MKKIILLFAMLVIVMGAKAEKNNSKTDSASASKFRKNEIAVNVYPFISAALYESVFYLDWDPSHYSYSFSYKRNLNEK